MCDKCSPGLSRRVVLALAAVGLASAGAAGGARCARAAILPVPPTPDEALARLERGNARYVGEGRFRTENLARQRAAVTERQAPFATVLTCADSRVPPELVFGGLGLGDLFVARNAGNLVDTGTLGTLEYGASVLGTPLIVVLGHQSCGAVIAACDAVRNETTFPGTIGAMIAPILPVARSIGVCASDMVDGTVRESARRTAESLCVRSALLAERVASGQLRIVAAHYALDSGRVTFLT